MQIILCRSLFSASGKRAQGEEAGGQKASDEWNHPRTFRADRDARSIAASAALPRRRNRARLSTDSGGRLRCASEKTRPRAGNAAGKTSGMETALERSHRIPCVRIGSEGALAETHVDRVVEPLHPEGHLGPAAMAGPIVRDPMERPPQGPSEADLEGQPGRTDDPRPARNDGMKGSIRIRRDLPLPQRSGYSVVVHKETDVQLPSSVVKRALCRERSNNSCQNKVLANLFCGDRDSPS